MPFNFLKLPNEVRNNIYEQLLVLQKPVICLTRQRPKHSHLEALTPGLLRANKTVCFETSSILYTQNCFSFTICTSEDIASFLKQIGRNNASYILRIYVDFPKLDYTDLNNIILEDDSVRIITMIQSECIELRTLITSIAATKALAPALALVDARFRAISSLQEIIVELYEHGPSGNIRTEMERYKWTIRTKASSLNLLYILSPSVGRSFNKLRKLPYHSIAVIGAYRDPEVLVIPDLQYFPSTVKKFWRL